MLGIDVPEAKTEPAPSFLEHLTDKAGRGLAVVDHWAMGIPSTMAGLLNSAIPGQPIGDLWSAKSAAQDARSAVAQSGGADLLALPEAFAGSMPSGVGHAAARETKKIVRPPETYPRPYEVNTLPPPPAGYVRAYHGSPSDFDQFQPPVFLSPSREAAERYVTGGGGNGNFNGLGTATGPTKSGFMYEVDLPTPSAEYIVPDLQRQGNPFIPAVEQAAKNGDAVASFRYGDTGRELAALDTSGVTIRNKYPFDPAEQFAYPGATLSETGPSNASAYLDLFGAGARQAGRLAESAIDPVYNAMPSNAAGIFGGKLTPPPGIEQVWGPKWDIAIGQQYRTAEAGGDLSTMYDILTAKLSKASGIDPSMRTAMEAKVREIRNDMGLEWRRLAGISDETPNALDAKLLPPPEVY